MRRLAIAISIIFSSLFSVYFVQAYVYYVEAEDFDPDRSEPILGGTWSVVENRDSFNEKYVQYSGPHLGATTSLIYPIPGVTDSARPWKIWIWCLMPDDGSDSYFFYGSTDDGGKWGPQQTVHGSGQGPDWKWENWVLSTPLEKGEGNVLRIAERENAAADLICIRNDGLVPSEQEYEKWLGENKDGRIAVEPFRRITAKWGEIKETH